nr:MAG TPA: hypothetical protein [Caudoviricetes sp.]
MRYRKPATAQGQVTGQVSEIGSFLFVHPFFVNRLGPTEKNSAGCFLWFRKFFPFRIHPPESWLTFPGKLAHFFHTNISGRHLSPHTILRPRQ